MSRLRPSATPNIKAKTMANAAGADVATRVGREENAQRPTKARPARTNVQHRSQTKTSVDTIVHREIDSAQGNQNAVGRIDIGKIDNKVIDLLQSTGRYRRSR
jgi:hypothetical protein